MSTIIYVLAILFAIAATVLAFIFIVPDKKRAKLPGILKSVHDLVNFKYLFVEKVLQALYIFSTALVLMLGFFMLFYVKQGVDYGWYKTDDVWYGGYGLLIMVLGPIAVRLAYEFTMMLILLVKNVIQINNKLKAQDGEVAADMFATPSFKAAAPAAPAAPAAEAEKAAFCPACGAKAGAGDFCAACGTKLK